MMTCMDSRKAEVFEEDLERSERLLARIFVSMQSVFLPLLLYWKKRKKIKLYSDMSIYLMHGMCTITIIIIILL